MTSLNNPDCQIDYHTRADESAMNIWASLHFFKGLAFNKMQY